MNNEELDKLEAEIQRSFLESHMNIQANCYEPIKANVLELNTEIANNSLRMIKEMRESK